MEVRQLQIFRTLAEELNFTRTAEKVHTVQSNVTAQIKALEDELGTPLFDRLGRRVTLTDAGRNFLPFASQALAAMDQGQRAIETGAEPSGPLRIGAPESVLTYRLPQVLHAFRRHFPHVELIFSPLHERDVCARARSRQARHGDHHGGLEAFSQHQVRPPAHGAGLPAGRPQPPACLQSPP